MTDTVTIRDNRTGKEYELPIEQGAIRSAELRDIKVSPDDFGLLAYDPAFMNTASCKSKITFIDGDKGILRYRGYPIEELAEKKHYLEVAYLLIYGELPSRSEYETWVHNITYHTMVHENVKKFMDGFHHDAHPMGMLVSTIAALSTFYPDAKNIFDEKSRQLQIFRLIGKIPTLAAFAYRHSQGMAYIYPSNDLSYSENFLSMMYRPSWTTSYEPNPVLAKALDILFILHADHEQNCSSTAMRVVGSSQADPYSSAAAATAALYGPLHGGANEEVVRMLEEIGSKDKVPEIIRQVKDGKRLLFGFGHRIYKNYDPRARIIKKIAEDVFEVTGRNELLDIALELEKVALSDDYFIKRKLYPNVDFYSGLMYQAMGFPMDIFTVLFAIPRMSGWLSQWQELILDHEQKIARPRQIYIGYPERHIP
ncbi:MAG: citrate synthase [Thaumarchaeota archaeon]|nr:citrate synthase [Nitrososphaerota archaeon]